MGNQYQHGTIPPTVVWPTSLPSNHAVVDGHCGVEIKKPNLPFAGIKRNSNLHPVRDLDFIKGDLHIKKR